jgi:hypothetical protein
MALLIFYKLRIFLLFLLVYPMEEAATHQQWRLFSPK